MEVGPSVCDASYYYKMQAFGGCNADPDSWDTDGQILVYGSGPCIVIQHLSQYTTVAFIPLSYGIITCVKLLPSGNLLVATCNGNLLILDTVTKEVISSYEFPTSVTHIAFDEDDVLVSICKLSDDVDYKGLYLFKIVDNQLQLQDVQLPDFKIISLGITKLMGTLIIALGHPDGNLKLFIPETQSEVTTDGTAWILSIKFCKENDESMLIAAAGQDRNIRIWRITTASSSSASKLNVAVAQHAFLQTSHVPFNLELVTNLSSHSDWINAIDYYDQKSLASVSFDGQVLIWHSVEGELDYDISIRLGTTAVSDDQSGFVGCKLIGANDVIAVSRNGGFSHWIDGKSVRCFAGHNYEVTGLTWTSIGCFVSVGLDNVGRIYGEKDNTFIEMARPLIHGHVMYDVVEISNECIAFAADEKCIRILQPTQCFAKFIGEPLTSKNLPFASMVPALTLTNKIIQTPDSVSSDFAPLTASDFMKDHIPNAHEMWLTRWPEIHSLWGHERELRQMTITDQWFASGDDRGGIIIWDRKTYAKRGYIKEISKRLTTALAGSPDSSTLLAVLESGKVKLISAQMELIKEFDIKGGLYAGGWALNSEYFAVGGPSGLYVYERDGNKASAHSDCGFVSAIEYISNYDMIVGFDNGEITHYHYDASDCAFNVVSRYQKHGDRVNDIKYNSERKAFLSCGNDHVVLLQPLSQ